MRKKKTIIKNKRKCISCNSWVIQEKCVEDKSAYYKCDRCGLIKGWSIK